MSKKLFLYFDVRVFDNNLCYVATVIDKEGDYDTPYSCVYLESIPVDEYTPANYFQRNYFGLRNLFGCDVEVSFSCDFLKVLAEKHSNAQEL